ncbi:heparinase II/III domain-containing protein [Pseudomonas inefficax]|uniref:heparinase II/III domain-containing protein n=1 Tax=Pseudomonas inefficax TaxID=2078786 RepID=UPI003266FEDD
MLKKIRDHFCKEDEIEAAPIARGNKPALDFLSDRDILDYRSFCNHGSKIDEPFNLQSFSGNARAAMLDGNPVFTFNGNASVYQLRFKMPRGYHGNGLHLRFRISDWEKLNYIGVGYTFEGSYRHVKIVNAARGEWIDFTIGHNDLAFGIQNDWAVPPACDFEEIKLYFKGQPREEGSTLEIERLTCWHENDQPAAWVTEGFARTPLPEALRDSLYAYMEKCFKDVPTQANDYLQKGICPLYGNIGLDWDWQLTLPDDLDAVGTYRFSWHSLHPAIILMLHARQEGSIAPLFPAREFTSNWLERSYFNADEDRKFAWYDHGTAERLLAFLMIWDIGVLHQFDTRFMVRLRAAIFKHAQLLASEMFYASHQASRYHNHAWFQDMALLATSLAMPDFPCSERWQLLALSRLTDQLDTLIVRDNGYAVFVENSIGYHQGVQRLIAFAGELAEQSSHITTIPTVAEELLKFSDFLRYPDNRSPAQGDTFRRANPDLETVRNCKNYPTASATILPTAGYAIIKGNHAQTAYMLTMFATSLCKTHKHQDNLSFTLFMDGIEWLIDPSFYSHEYLKPIQSFLRGPYSHNNPVIGDVPYSIEPGHAQLDGEVIDNEFALHGSHDAFADTVVKRSITGHLEYLQLDISDEIHTTLKDKPMFSLFHCGDGTEVIKTQDGVEIRHPASSYRVTIASNCPCTIVTGWNDDQLVKGISGLGFMQQGDTSMVAFEMKNALKARFTITAHQN